MAVHENTMSLLIARYLRSSHDKFIEQATLALGYCEDKYVEGVVGKNEDKHFGYAKAEFCVVLGFRQKKECAELLRREVGRMRQEYKDDSRLALETMIIRSV